MIGIEEEGQIQKIDTEENHLVEEWIWEGKV